MTCNCANREVTFEKSRQGRVFGEISKLAHNLEVAGSNPVPATCFSSSETGRPPSYRKGRCREVAAFLRSIASCGNNFERRGTSLSRRLLPPRDKPFASTQLPNFGQDARLSLSRVVGDQRMLVPLLPLTTRGGYFRIVRDIHFGKVECDPYGIQCIANNSQSGGYEDIVRIGRLLPSHLTQLAPLYCCEPLSFSNST